MADLIGNDHKSASRFTSSCCLYRGIKRQDVRLLRDVLHHVQHFDDRGYCFFQIIDPVNQRSGHLSGAAGLRQQLFQLLRPLAAGFSHSACGLVHLGICGDYALHLSSNQIGKLIAALGLLSQTSCTAGNLFGRCSDFLRGDCCLAGSIAKLACSFQYFTGRIRCLGNELRDPLHHHIKGSR
ncbi:hypothetical protein D3C73_720700 [compost metagenome]